MHFLAQMLEFKTQYKEMFHLSWTGLHLILMTDVSHLSQRGDEGEPRSLSHPCIKVVNLT